MSKSKIEDTEDLLKGSLIIREFLGRSHCEIVYQMNENKKTEVLKENPNFKEKREREIAHFKAFSAKLKIPDMTK
jgi:hypothetical protein